MISLDKLEQLEAKAMPGPWQAYGEVYATKGGSYLSGVKTLAVVPYHYDVVSPYVSYEDSGTTEAVFIAEMRNSLPAILRRLRAADALREGVAYYYHGCAAGDRNIYCELCRVLAKYDKAVEGAE